MDYVAADTDDLFAQVGRCGAGGAGAISLQHPGVCGATVLTRGIALAPGLFHALIDPNLAFLFFWVGLILIVLEVLHPGISVPGILGAVFLVTAFVEFGFFPVQIVGVVLLLASALFFLLEIKHPGIGAPTVGGTVTLVLGGLLLFNSAVPSARVSPWLIGLVAAIAVVFFGFVVGAAVKTRRMPKRAGDDDLRGQEGTAIDDLSPTGRVRVRRENWSAESTGAAIPKGTGIRVMEVKGLRLMVEPIGALPPGEAPSEQALAEH